MLGKTILSGTKGVQEIKDAVDKRKEYSEFERLVMKALQKGTKPPQILSDREKDAIKDLFDSSNCHHPRRKKAKFKSKFSKLDNSLAVAIVESPRRSFGFNNEEESPYFKSTDEEYMGKMNRRRTYVPNRDLAVKLQEMEMVHYLEQ